MSPGVTFERVYHELKRMLTEGELPPGTPIEPALIGKQIASSITPIRDALHRLTGERLVEAPNHNGFRVPLLTESGLRDLYGWNGQLLDLCVKTLRDDLLPALLYDHALVDNPSFTAGTLFFNLARATGSVEHSSAIAQLNERLAPYRRVEGRILSETPEEVIQILHEAVAVNRGSLARLLKRYHQRRTCAVAQLLTASISSPL